MVVCLSMRPGGELPLFTSPPPDDNWDWPQPPPCDPEKD